MRQVGHLARMEVVGKSEGKKTILGHIRSRDDNIKMDLKRDRMRWYELD
jgi:hypothetical protein